MLRHKGKGKGSLFMEYTAALIFYIIPLLLQSFYFHSQSIVEYTKPRSSPFCPCVLSLLPGPLKYRPRAKSTMSPERAHQSGSGNNTDIINGEDIKKELQPSTKSNYRRALELQHSFSMCSWYLGTCSASHR